MDKGTLNGHSVNKGALTSVIEDFLNRQRTSSRTSTTLYIEFFYINRSYINRRFSKESLGVMGSSIDGRLSEFIYAFGKFLRSLDASLIFYILQQVFYSGWIKTLLKSLFLVSVHL